MSKQTCDGCGIEHDPMDWHAEQLHDEYACVREALQTARSKLDEQSKVVDALEQQNGSNIERCGELQSRLDSAEERARLRTEDKIALQTELDVARSRLDYFRQRSIRRGPLEYFCLICKGSWAHSRGEEMHEGWCPHTPATHHTVVVEKPLPKSELPKLAEWEADKGARVSVYDGPNTPESK